MNRRSIFPPLFVGLTLLGLAFTHAFGESEEVVERIKPVRLKKQYIVAKPISLATEANTRIEATPIAIEAKEESDNPVKPAVLSASPATEEPKVTSEVEELNAPTVEDQPVSESKEPEALANSEEVEPNAEEAQSQKNFLLAAISNAAKPQPTNLLAVNGTKPEEEQVEPKPIAEVEPVAEFEPIVEVTPVAEVAPIGEMKPVAEVEPIATSDLLAEVNSTDVAVSSAEVAPIEEMKPTAEVEQIESADPTSTPVSEPVAEHTSYAVPTRSSWRQRYELGPGDELNFGLHGKPTLKKLAVAVAPDGTISYLQAKQIDVRGKTIDELRQHLNGILADYHRDARVIITPSKLGSKQYTVLGEVRKNGTYSLDRPVTLLQALAEAGGFNLGKSGEGAVQLADLRRSFVVRNGNRIPVDMESLYLAGDMTQNVHVEPGDYIYVASKLRNEVYVFGSVNTPGVKAIESRMTTLGAIAAAEGFSEQAWRDRVLIIRGKMDNPETIVMPLNKVLHGKSHDIEILPGDIVYVHNRPWAYATRILDAAILAYVDGSFAGWLADDGNIAITSGS